MRTKQRLIEVIETVNPKVHPEAWAMFRATIRHKVAGCRACKLNIAYLITKTDSPHIRELATEALHYLENPEAGVT